jgi:hypothetical protein
MNKIKIWIVAALVLLALAAGRTLSSDPEWSYEARTDGQIMLLDYPMVSSDSETNPPDVIESG